MNGRCIAKIYYQVRRYCPPTYRQILKEHMPVMDGLEWVTGWGQNQSQHLNVNFCLLGKLANLCKSLNLRTSLSGAHIAKIVYRLISPRIQTELTEIVVGAELLTGSESAATVIQNQPSAKPSSHNFCDATSRENKTVQRRLVPSVHNDSGGVGISRSAATKPRL